MMSGVVDMSKNPIPKPKRTCRFSGWRLAGCACLPLFFSSSSFRCTTIMAATFCLRFASNQSKCSSSSLFLVLALVSVLTIFDEMCTHPRVADAHHKLQSSRQKLLKLSSLVTNELPSHCHKNATAPRLRAAVVMFGIPKDFASVWKFYQSHLIVPNAQNVDFSVTMHLYSDVTTLTNPKNGERGVPIQTTEEILQIFREATPDLPVEIVPSVQAEYDASLEWISDDVINGRFDQPPWNPETLRNMFRQGNSMAQAYAKAQPHDVAVFLRADTLLTTPVLLSCSSARTNDAEKNDASSFPPDDLWLPSWQVHNDEYVDRLAVAGVHVASLYAHAKIQGMRMMVQDQSKSQKPISKSSGDFLRNSEHMLFLWLHAPDNRQHVRIVRMPPTWGRLVRVRGGQILNRRDVRTHLRPFWWTRLVLAIASLVSLAAVALVGPYRLLRIRKQHVDEEEDDDDKVVSKNLTRSTSHEDSSDSNTAACGTICAARSRRLSPESGAPG